MYKTIGEKGKGGFGIVEEVEDSEGNRFARKTYYISQNFKITPQINEHFKKRFVREANLQSGLDHRNIVPILSKNLDEDPAYFIMPLAQSTLEDDIKNKVADGNWLKIILDIISGLEEMHPLRIFHRDLKPANVLRFQDPDNSKDCYYAISDFGLIALKHTQVSVLTQVGMKMTSDFYTAPEITQDLANASAQSDIYSIGCIIHDFVGVEARVPCNEIREDGNYSAILLNCTRKDPTRRFESVTALRDALLDLTDSYDPPKTTEAKELIELLNSENELSQKDWAEYADYIENNLEESDTQSALRALNQSRLNDVIKKHPEIAKKIGLRYSEWIRNTEFPFSSCDALSSRLEAFLLIDDVELQAEALMAMLYLGTSHNRWYVERKFFNKITPTADELLCKRLAVQFRADGSKLCSAFSHLERSINVNRKNIHPTLLKTLENICDK